MTKPNTAAPRECTDLRPCGKCALCLWSYENYVRKEREIMEGTCFDPDEARDRDFYKRYGLE